MNSSLSRRRFLQTAGVAATVAPFLARRLAAASPELPVLRHASFGAAGMAWADIQSICANPFVKLVAVAEVDHNRLSELKAAFPDVRVYQDWRVLLEREGDQIDSVNVSTPDHLHAPMALAAMQLGKHVYCQKPLAHDLREVRVLTEYAREKRVVTQMGIQVHSMPPYRMAATLLQSGVIGRVREVHTWSNKRWGDVGPPPAAAEVPSGFNWDLWLGGCAVRPFVGNQYYHPENWRKRLDFGTGTFGDMGCHIFDPVFAGLGLTAPLRIRSEGPAPDAWNWSVDSRIHYEFPGSALTADTTLPLTWYDGTNRPPDDIIALVDDPKRVRKPGGDDDPLDQGSIVVGTAGTLHLPHVLMPRLFPQEKFKDFVFPKVVNTNHWADWAEACVGGPGRPAAPFDYSGPLTETVLLGSVAVRFPHRTLEWNSATLRFANEPAANELVRRSYREGWRVGGL